jgi:hypothetical protein
MRALTYPYENTPDSCIAGLTALAWNRFLMARIRRDSIVKPATSARFKLESTVRYLGIEVDDALNIAEQIEL